MLQFIQSCWSNYLGVADVAEVVDVADVAQAEQVVPVILLVTQESWLVTLAYTPGAFDWGGFSIFNF